MYERSRNLFDCHIAGFTYYDGLEVIGALKVGKKVHLRVEPENPYDPKAVAIFLNHVKLGYIPQDSNDVISDMLYFGYGDFIEARINFVDITARPERQYRIVVKLKDIRTP